MKVAAAHVSPVFMDAAASTKKAVHFIEQAQREGLDLIVFPETFIPGFPVRSMLVERICCTPISRVEPDAAAKLDH